MRSSLVAMVTRLVYLFFFNADDSLRAANKQINGREREKYNTILTSLEEFSCLKNILWFEKKTTINSLVN